MNNNFKKIEIVIEQYLSWVPISLTIREITRINALLKINHFTNAVKNKKKIIDIGCGDGKWWKFSGIKELKRIVGIDISRNEIKLASKIIDAKLFNITDNNIIKKFDKKFDLAIGSCSMEHIRNINDALTNINRLLNVDGILILILPTPDWAMNNTIISTLYKIFPRISMSFSGLINGFFQHWHLYNYKVWIELLKNYGFKVENTYGLGNKNTSKIFWSFLPLSFFSFIIKFLTNRYFIFYLSSFIPRMIKIKVSSWIEKKLEKNLISPDDSEIFEYMIICRKTKP